MNREIKFRAWNKEKKIMCYAHEDNGDEYWDGAYGSDVEIINNTLKSICDEYEYMQYIGRNDKNGKEIYEGDIVKKEFYTDYEAYANSEEYIGVVKFQDCAWVIETKRDGRICFRPIFEAMAYSEDVEHFEVVGNIFDNPELLEDSE